MTYGGIGERTGLPPTMAEYDNIARALTAAAKHAKTRGHPVRHRAGEPLREPPDQHRLAGQWMIEKVGADNIFIHLDTYHMNIEEKGAGNGILDAREHLQIHPPVSESDRGTPGEGTCDWDEVFATLAAIGFKGGLAMESFINMPPEVGYGLAVWRPVAKDFDRGDGQRPALPARQGHAVPADLRRRFQHVETLQRRVSLPSARMPATAALGHLYDSVRQGNR